MEDPHLVASGYFACAWCGPVGPGPPHAPMVFYIMAFGLLSLYVVCFFIFIGILSYRVPYSLVASYAVMLSAQSLSSFLVQTFKPSFDIKIVKISLLSDENSISPTHVDAHCSPS